MFLLSFCPSHDLGSHSRLLLVPVSQIAQDISTFENFHVALLILADYRVSLTKINCHHLSFCFPFWLRQQDFSMKLKKTFFRDYLCMLDYSLLWEWGIPVQFKAN